MTEQKKHPRRTSLFVFVVTRGMGYSAQTALKKLRINAVVLPDNGSVMFRTSRDPNKIRDGLWAQDKTGAFSFCMFTEKSLRVLGRVRAIPSLVR